MSFKAWWTAWRELFWKLLALAASFASLVGLLFPFLPSPRDLPWWAMALLILALLSFVVLIGLEVFQRRGRRVYREADSEGIKRYMHKLIKHGGRVAVWTRDMSWANNPETYQLLTDKARRGELILCLPEPNEFTANLTKAGAEVCTYGAKLLESPASRFTIAFFGRDGARVAVGRAEGETHVIDEFSSGGHPAFHLAADLVTLVRALQVRDRE